MKMGDPRSLAFKTGSSMLKNKLLENTNNLFDSGAVSSS
jgi:hypothetical protein